MTKISLAGYVTLVTLILPLASQAENTDGGGLYKKHACDSCHGKNGQQPISPDYPLLAGQNARYLLRQMVDIRAGTRANGLAATMKAAVAQVSDEDFTVIAEWLSQK